MSGQMSLAQRLLISACAATRTTELAARRLGAGYFLPALFVLRYALMGGHDRDVFGGQLAGARSFTDERWCAYWDAIAEEHVAAAADALSEMGGPSPSALQTLLDGDDPGTVDALRDLVAPVAWMLGDHGPQPSRTAIERIVHEHAGESAAATGQLVGAAVAVDELVKAITYLQVSAFPGGRPCRMRAYHRSRRLFDALIDALEPGLGITVERIRVPIDGDVVEGYATFPAGTERCATVLITNGLEGTVQELMIPNLRYRDSGLGVVMVEMPGSYAYKQPMSSASEAIYHQVIEHVAAHPRVDASRMGFVGTSFGGYWAARMAATSTKLRCAVACGAPTDHSFGASLGTPQIILQALVDVTGASGPLDLSRKLHSLSLRDMYGQITIPLLVINGDTDTLLSTQDSIDLAHGARNSTLRLYPNDDHCAMGHYREWLDLSQQWLRDQLASVETPA